MSIEKFWLLEFGSNLSIFGKGVAVLETGKIFAGDSGYYYTGDYETNNGTINAKIKVVKHNPLFISIFGDVNEFSIIFENQNISSGLNGATIKGHVEGQRDLQVYAKFTKIAELP
ncbi:MAG TPA: hypothetical protein PKW30_06245 [Campylobacterales bacterium]|nr:hypothetical protein [Campylobacterales bacterium]